MTLTRHPAARAAELMIAALLCVAGATAKAIEEPRYRVVQQTDDYEIRRYDAYIVAEVDMQGDLRSSDGSAFRILAGYIFGANQGESKMAMTAPVETRAADAGTRMKMTAPVTAAPNIADSTSYTYAFVMESRFTLESLPTPNDPRIRLRRIEPRTVAAHRYSGRWTAANYREHEQRLLDALERDRVPVSGTPMIARYNGPMTPWFLRRNEALVEIAWPPGDG